ncbi:RNA polymerase subunit sigma-70 [Catenulispora pinisilvae]|uniref:RNA polymerase subunit sigma-70 n=1 Tax=Catenulispora pinisilvae TaxID=2705253 RepID=UPI001E5499D8|nr:RNA polymerase subunit sigma-70 [Catenulispora pinisilvae]
MPIETDTAGMSARGAGAAADTSELIARARAGDHNAFRDLVQGHSHELQVHCYRILGSLQDAEDALQETLVSAWRSLGEFGQRSSLRTWLYQIATNRCLSMLRADSRRPRIAAPLPEAAVAAATGVGDAPPWLEPYPDVLLDHLVDQRPGPEARYESTEAISLAFITALQLLPPRQRAALVLRDVLGYHAAEVAQMLDTTQEAVSSALKRARATVDSHLGESESESGDSGASDSSDGSDGSSSGGSGNGTDGRSAGLGSRRPARRPDSAAEHRLVARFTDALERADLDALIDLFVTDVRLSMPPAMLEYRGIESAHRILATAAFRPGRTYRVVATRANGQPAFGLYLADPHTSVHHAYCFLVITTAGDRITAVTSFSTNLMAHFGLPRTLPETD